MKTIKVDCKKIAIILLLVLIAFSSATFVAEQCSSPETYKDTIASIDDKTKTVLALSGSSALVANALSLLHDDWGAPLADTLMDLSGCFLFILAILYSEKYLLTLLGLAVFRFLVPFAAVIGGISLFFNSEVSPEGVKKARALAIKIAVFGILLVAVIPLCMKASDLVYNTYEESFKNTAVVSDSFVEDTSNVETDESGSVIDRIIDRVTGLPAKISTVAKNLVNRFVESVAVMLVTVCVVPIASLLLFVWIIKTFTGLDFLPAINSASNKVRAGAKQATVGNYIKKHEKKKNEQSVAERD